MQAAGPALEGETLQFIPDLISRQAMVGRTTRPETLHSSSNPGLLSTPSTCPLLFGENRSGILIRRRNQYVLMRLWAFG
jgi:hypothetical protein